MKLYTGQPELDRVQDERAKELLRATFHPLSRGLLQLDPTVMLTGGEIRPDQSVVVYAGRGGDTLRLPKTTAADGRAQAIWVANGGTGAGGDLTLATQGGETISGAKSYTVRPGHAAFVVSDGGQAGKWTVSPGRPDIFTGVNIQAFTASGTYTPTAGMKFCIAIVTAGGGGGGGADTSGAAGTSGVGGGGGAGQTRIGLFTAAQVGASLAVTRGAGGAGGAAAGANGAAGATSALGALISAGGGGFGSGSGTSASTVSDAVGGSGGSGGSGGQIGVNGADGGAGAAGSCDGTTDLHMGTSGYGGASFWGGGGRSVSRARNSLASATGAAGIAGAAPGSGGSGAINIGDATDLAGGAGANGIVVIIEFT